MAQISIAQEINVKLPDKSNRLLDCASGSGLLGQEVDFLSLLPRCYFDKQFQQNIPFTF